MAQINRGDAAALIPEEVASSIIDSLPGTSAVFSNPLVNRVTMSRKVQRMPILAMNPVAYWVDGDDGAIDTTSAAWANKYLENEKLAAIVPVPRDVLEDAEYDLWAQVAPKITQAIAAKFDRAVLFGDAAPASFPTAVAFDAVARNHVALKGTGVDLAADFNDAFGLVEADGFAVNGVVARNTVKAMLRGLRTEDNALVYQGSTAGIAGASSDAPTVFGEPIIYATNGTFVGTINDPETDEPVTNPVLAIVGDWSQIFLGIRKDMTVEVLREATIGGVNLAETDQVGLKVTFRGGWQVANPPTAENGDNETRYPFAIVSNLLDGDGGSA